MKKINIILYIFCAVAIITSCKGFLDIPPSNQGDASTAIQDENDAQVFMNGIMRRMSSGAYYGRNFILYADAKGGDLGITSQGRGYDSFYTFNHSATSNSYSGFWSQMYDVILQINTLIKSVEGMEDASSTMLAYLAQAKTLRAIVYFDLVRLYGKPYNMDKSSYGVPLALEPLDASDQLTRASVEEVYNQIIKDLKESEDQLSTSRQNGYVNKYVNKTMQARVYLYMDNHASALAAAEDVINSGVYSLYKPEEWVESWESQFGNESIFEIAMYPNEGDLGTSSLGFMLRRYAHGSTKAMGWFMASDYFLARLGESTSDVRWGVMSYDEISDTRFGACYKYCGSTELTGDGKSAATSVNIKVIRLSEVYLIAAEAALATDKAKAAKYLNAIRKRSGLADATDANINIKMILDERSKELFAEGHRFFDMMRLNQTIELNDEMIQPAVSITHRDKTVTRDFYKTILPIAKSELDANPPIAAQQNPGY